MQPGGALPRLPLAGNSAGFALYRVSGSRLQQAIHRTELRRLLLRGSSTVAVPPKARETPAVVFSALSSPSDRLRLPLLSCELFRRRIIIIIHQLHLARVIIKPLPFYDKAKEGKDQCWTKSNPKRLDDACGFSEG